MGHPSFPTGAATDRGRSRQRNEDAVLVSAEMGLLVVADGMGGHPAGDVASALAAEEVERQLRRSEGSPGSLGERMLEAVLRADALIREQGEARPGHRGMGTTVTALVARPGEARVAIAHVGDSRAYLLAGGRLTQLTRDHTWIEEEIAAGRLTRAQARGHRWGHVLTQAAGAGDEIAPDLLEPEAIPGQIYLLCTDGLTNMLTELAMERTLEDALPGGLEAAAQALVDAANDRGGIDNVTVALVRID